MELKKTIIFSIGFALMGAMTNFLEATEYKVTDDPTSIEITDNNITRGHVNESRGFAYIDGNNARVQLRLSGEVRQRISSRFSFVPDWENRIGFLISTFEIDLTPSGSDYEGNIPNTINTSLAVNDSFFGWSDIPRKGDFENVKVKVSPADQSATVSFNLEAEHHRVTHHDFGQVVHAADVTITVPLTVLNEGDLNGDGQVNFDDFLIVATYFGREVGNRTFGDANRDGKVDFTDFLIIARNFGE